MLPRVLERLWPREDMSCGWCWWNCARLCWLAGRVVSVPGSADIGGEMMYPVPGFGCEKCPCTLVFVGVAADGWLYELPRDGRRAPPPRVLPVFGRDAEADWGTNPAESDAALV